jgi:hypothetical protein
MSGAAGRRGNKRKSVGGDNKADKNDQQHHADGEDDDSKKDSYRGLREANRHDRRRDLPLAHGAIARSYLLHCLGRLVPSLPPRRREWDAIATSAIVESVL